jgi:hypothetical protein
LFYLQAKIDDDKKDDQEGIARKSLAVYSHHFFKKVMGLQSCADVQVARLFRACECHVLQVNIFIGIIFEVIV